MQIIDWQNIESMSEIHENLAIERTVKEHYDNKSRELRILEIGSFKGRSTAILAQFGKVFSIDLHSNIDIGIKAYDTIGQMAFPDFIRNMIRLKLIDRVFPIISTSNILEELPNMEFDVIYIDGCHEYFEVLKDLCKSFRHLTDDGLLMFDDAMRPNFIGDSSKDPWWGVSKAIKEFLDLGEFGVYYHYCGFVVLKRREYIKKTIRIPIEAPTFEWR